MQILSCDWGTSSFRLRLVDVSEERVLAEFHDADGIAATFNAWQDSGQKERITFFTSILQKKIKKLDPSFNLPVLISGMASSSIGMMPLPFTSLPFALDGKNMEIKELRATTPNEPMDLYLFSGVKSDNDVMRGEEILLLGTEAHDEEVIVIPGTHSKHIRVEQDFITGFQTFMTGEFFELLATKSILAHSTRNPDNFDRKAFAEGVSVALTGNILTTSFQVRVRHLFDESSPGENYHFLSGLIIGTELKELSAGTRIKLIGSNKQLHLYKEGLRVLFPSATIFSENADETFVKGHCRLAKIRGIGK